MCVCVCVCPGGSSRLGKHDDLLKERQASAITWTLKKSNKLDRKIRCVCAIHVSMVIMRINHTVWEGTRLGKSRPSPQVPPGFCSPCGTCYQPIAAIFSGPDNTTNKARCASQGMLQPRTIYRAREIYCRHFLDQITRTAMNLLCADLGIWGTCEQSDDLAVQGSTSSVGQLPLADDVLIIAASIKHNNSPEAVTVHSLPHLYILIHTHTAFILLGFKSCNATLTKQVRSQVGVVCP